MTLIFPQAQLMLAFLCDCSTAACVQSKINFLYEVLFGMRGSPQSCVPHGNAGQLSSRGGDAFWASASPHAADPGLYLTDNGFEFSNPTAIEIAPDGSLRTKVFYCDPMASWQKPHVERNHEFIRLILPKGSSFDDLTQEKVGLMMSHINSYVSPGQLSSRGGDAFWASASPHAADPGL